MNPNSEITQVLRAMEELKRGTIEDVLSLCFGISKRNIQTHLSMLVQKGKLKRIGARQYPNPEEVGPKSSGFKNGRPCTEFEINGG